ncbi:MAG: hypothetical protein IJL90_07405, partial [Lachnospiraceae bacterium]|nr:hypothetical protein [Lachnospiraceae bacterium]
ADPYVVWYYVKGDMLHKDTDKARVTANINKRKVVVTVDDACKETGAPDPEFTGSVEGVIDGEDLGIVYKRSDINDANSDAAGIHEGVLTVIFTKDVSNYDIEVRNGNFTIGNLTAVWLNGDDSVLLTKTYPAGQAVPSYDGRTPVKTETSDYTYKWIGWDGGTVDGTVTTFRPLFTPVSKVKKGVLTLDAGAGTYKTVPSGFTYDAAAHKLSIVANVGDDITMPAGPVLEGYKFLYWKGSEYYPGEKYKVEGDHNFTAMWEKVKSDGPSDHHSSEITEETVHPSQNQPAVAQTPAGNAAVDKAPVTGDSAENKTTEKKGSNRSGSPDTGDESNSFWWLMMFIASFAVLIGALAYPKKK